MTLDLKTLNQAILTHAGVSGQVDYVFGAPAEKTVGNGVSFELYLSTIQPYAAGSGLASVAVVVVQNVVLAMNDDPGHVDDIAREDIDPRMAEAADAMCRIYANHFTLGGLIRNVDIFGAAGQGSLGARAGWAYKGGPEGPRRRIMAITLPMIINDLWDEAA